MDEAPAIRAVDLRKSFGDVQALDGLSFAVDRGEFFGLLGPNGAGKTTFINVLVGLAHSDGGTAEVFGYDVEAEYQEARDRIGLAPQEFNVDRFFPIHEVLEHKAGYHGVPPGEAERRAEEALKTVGIWDKRETRFDWLSGGMKRRFLLARALVTDPDLLILDEPTAGVDVQLRRELCRVIERLNAGGTTVLLTTHYIEEAERLCDRVAIVEEGSVVEVATPDDLRARGTDQVSLTLADAPAAVPDAIGDVEGVVDAHVDGDALVVTARGGGRAAPALLRALERAGDEVVDLEIRRASLEEVFVEMTRLDHAAGDADTAGDADGVGSAGDEDRVRGNGEHEEAPDRGVRQ